MTDAEWDAWIAEQKERIREACEHLNRSMGQKFRHLRERLLKGTK